MDIKLSTLDGRQIARNIQLPKETWEEITIKRLLTKKSLELDNLTVSSTNHLKN